MWSRIFTSADLLSRSHNVSLERADFVSLESVVSGSRLHHIVCRRMYVLLYSRQTPIQSPECRTWRRLQSVPSSYHKHGWYRELTKRIFTAPPIAARMDSFRCRRSRCEICGLPIVFPFRSTDSVLPVRGRLRSSLGSTYPILTSPIS